MKEVIQEFLESSLWRKGKKLSWDGGISRWLLRLVEAIKTSQATTYVFAGLCLSRQSLVSRAHLGGQQACQVDFWQDLFAVALSV